MDDRYERYCPRCGSKLEVICLASVPSSYQVRCKCITSDVESTIEMAFDNWKVSLAIDRIVMASSPIGKIKTSKKFEQVIAEHSEKLNKLLK